MQRVLQKWCVVLAAISASAAAWSGPYDTAANKGISWLAAQQNLDDGSWGSVDAIKYVQTSESVLALAAYNQLGTTYFNGVAWLGNHAPSNIDFTSRRVLALGAASSSVTADLAALQSAQNSLATGNNGWGLSGNYLGAPLDTALSLQALNQQGITTNVAAAVTYLTGAQLVGTDNGWAIGRETTSDPVTTAQVLIALVPLKSVSAAVPTALTKGLATLNANVNATSPTQLVALSIIANLRNNPSSPQAGTLLTALQGQQSADGSWGEDPFLTALAIRALAAAAGKDLSAQKQVIAVPDNALRGAINAALGHGALDAITVGGIQQLTALNASGLDITSLTGLQYATDLVTLNVSNNDITSFAPVANLTATINETGNPGYVSASVPTLPEWALIILGLLVVLVGLSNNPKTNQLFRKSL
ncbi:hypothetical protein AAKU67_004061 [Oxalobacteraceae bacterium GrIS 2.11]